MHGNARYPSGARRVLQNGWARSPNFSSVYKQRNVSVFLGKTLAPNCVLSFLSLTTCIVRPSDWHLECAAAMVFSRVSANARLSSPLALTMNILGPVWVISLVLTQPANPHTIAANKAFIVPLLFLMRCAGARPRISLCRQNDFAYFKRRHLKAKKAAYWISRPVCSSPSPPLPHWPQRRAQAQGISNAGAHSRQSLQIIGLLRPPHRHQASAGAARTDSSAVQANEIFRGLKCAIDASNLAHRKKQCPAPQRKTSLRRLEQSFFFDVCHHLGQTS